MPTFDHSVPCFLFSEKNTVFWIFFDSVQIVVYRLIVSVLLASICFWRNVRRQLSVEFNRSPLHSLLTSTVNSTVKNFCSVILAHFLISSLQPFNSIQLPHLFCVLLSAHSFFIPTFLLATDNKQTATKCLHFHASMIFISIPGYFECLQFSGVMVRWKWKFSIFYDSSPLCIDSDSFSISLPGLHVLSLQHSTFSTSANQSIAHSLSRIFALSANKYFNFSLLSTILSFIWKFLRFHFSSHNVSYVIWDWLSLKMPDDIPRIPRKRGKKNRPVGI